MTRVVRLTAAMVAGAKARGVSEVMLHDADVPGLALRVRQSGAKTWVLRRTVDGRQERRVLGTPDSLSVAEARDAARAVILGPLPGRDAAPPPASMSFAKFAALYRERMADDWKPSTRDGFDSALRLHLLPVFGARPMNRITAEEVTAWFHGISKERSGRANRLLCDMRAMFNRAREWKVIAADAPHPCALLRRNRRDPVWRILSLEELGRLGKALDRLAEAKPDETSIIRLLLLTGCRVGEIMRLKWQEVRDDRLELGDSKTGPRAIPLPAAAIAILKARRPPRRAAGYVFPSPVDRRRPRSNIDTAWMQVKRAADIEGTLRLHDLRHTYASRALMQGETLQMAGKLLGHRRTATTERYAHLEDSFLIAAAERVSARIAAMLG